MNISHNKSERPTLPDVIGGIAFSLAKSLRARGFLWVAPSYRRPAGQALRPPNNKCPRSAAPASALRWSRLSGLVQQIEVPARKSDEHSWRTDTARRTSGAFSRQSSWMLVLVSCERQANKWALSSGTGRTLPPGRPLHLATCMAVSCKYPGFQNSIISGPVARLTWQPRKRNHNNELLADPNGIEIGLLFYPSSGSPSYRRLNCCRRCCLRCCC